jgi:hypothetical protein
MLQARQRRDAWRQHKQPAAHALAWLMLANPTPCNLAGPDIGLVLHWLEKACEVTLRQAAASKPAAGAWSVTACATWTEWQLCVVNHIQPAIVMLLQADSVACHAVHRTAYPPGKLHVLGHCSNGSRKNT